EPGELRVLGAGHEQKRQLQSRKAVVECRLRARADAAQRGGEAVHAVFEPLRVRARECLAAEARLRGEEWLRPPARHEGLEAVALQAARELLVGAHTGGALGRVREASRRSDQERGAHALWAQRGQAQGDAPAQRVAEYVRA